MLKKLVVVAGAVLVSGSAWAADLPVKAPSYVPPAPPVYNWNGCYIGGHAGGQWADIDYSFNAPGPINVPAAGARSFNDMSFIGGGQIGCNWQPVGAQYVLGIEGDGSWADYSVGGEVFRYPNVIDHFDATADLGAQGSVRGRLGFAVDNLLFYATGGVAFGDASVSAMLVRDGVGSATNTSSKTLVGWTVGGGIEWGFSPHWSARFEYRYTDFGSIDFTVPASTFPAGYSAYTTSTNFTTNDVRAGINYRF